MTLQTVQGKTVEVVEFDTMPQLPITGLTAGESAYKNLTKGNGITLASLCGGLTYAQILQDAIETGVISEPGKYGLYKIPGTLNYEVHKIIE